MSPLSAANPNQASENLRGLLPLRMKVLYVTTLHRPGGWLVDALGSDSATEVILVETLDVTEGAARLRDEVFDAVLVSHETDILDAVELVEGLRGGGSDLPIVVLGTEPLPEMSAVCFEVGADAYLRVQDTTTRSLIWTLARAVEHHALIRNNRKLEQDQRHRLHHEHQEADRLLQQQRSLVDELRTFRASTDDQALVAGVAEELNKEDASPSEIDAAERAPAPESALPDRLVTHYRELMRAYVIMGAGNLADEIKPLAELLIGGGVTARQAVQMHLSALEDLVRGLGNRSARHVMNRADLMVLELMVHLADGYRQHFLQKQKPLRQKPLPGFSSAESPPVESPPTRADEFANQS